VERINVSLDSWTRHVCPHRPFRPLAQVLDGIAAAQQAGLKVRSTPWP